MKAIGKYCSLLFVILMANSRSWACSVCEKQQPEITQGLTHGTGPQSGWDWVIIGVMAAICLLTLFYSLKYLIRPNEGSANHIKQSILAPEGNEW